ncbi:MAG: hypothetical protein ACRC9R_07905 [Enterovibrio sp.]
MESGQISGFSRRKMHWFPYEKMYWFPYVNDGIWRDLTATAKKAKGFYVSKVLAHNQAYIAVGFDHNKSNSSNDLAKLYENLKALLLKKVGLAYFLMHSDIDGFVYRITEESDTPIAHISDVYGRAVIGAIKFDAPPPDWW